MNNFLRLELAKARQNYAAAAAREAVNDDALDSIERAYWDGYADAMRAAIDNTATDLMAGVIVVCPRHDGNFDCTPFCELCEGNQEFPEQVWRRRFLPDTFECGDGYHECDDDDEHEHATYLMFYEADGSDDDAISAAPGRVWSLSPDNLLTAGRDPEAEWLFITHVPTNG